MQSCPKTSPAAFPLLEQSIQDTGTFARPHTADQLRGDAAGAFPQQSFSLQGVQPSILGPAATSRSCPNGNNLGHGPIPVEDHDSASRTHMIQVAAEAVPELGYFGHSHMAIVALFGMRSSRYLRRFRADRFERFDPFQLHQSSNIDVHHEARRSAEPAGLGIVLGRQAEPSARDSQGADHSNVAVRRSVTLSLWSSLRSPVNTAVTVHVPEGAGSGGAPG